MTAQTFNLPDLGEGLTEAIIIKWLVSVGDTVVIDQPVVEVETAKASVEVPVPFAGTIVELHGDPGAAMPVGSPLITVRGNDSTDPGDSPSADAFAQHREEERAGSGNVLIGYGTSTDEGPTRRRKRTHEPAVGTVTKVISPLVRKLAADKGINLAQASGTGAGGVITRSDVERLVSTNPPAGAGNVTRIPVTGIRKVIADKLSISRREIPEATVWVDVDATELLAAKRLLSQTQSISLLALLARLTVAALKQFPELNATFDTGRQEILQYSDIHLGVAVQAPYGLVVPVISQADTLDTVALSDALAEVIALARDSKLPPAKMSGGTVTLNNYGVFGVDGSAAIINHPEAAILGVGRIIDRPWVVDGQLTVRKTMELTLSFDHRVCDGGSAAGFLRLFADYVENPVAALGRL